MKLLDRYILKQFLGAFVFTVLIIVSVIVVIDITEKTEKFGKAELTFQQIAGFYMDFIPWIANFITPLTVFIATVFITSKLAGRTEIIAILSSGVSFRRMLLPYMIGALMIGILSFILTGWVIPNSNKDRIDFEYKYLTKSHYFNETNVHMQVAPGKYLYLRNYNNQADVGYNFTLEAIDSMRLTEKLSSSRISWNEEKNKWTLTNWTLHKFNGQLEEITSGRTMDTTLAIHPSEFETIDNTYEGMTIPELDQEIAKLRMRGASNVEFYLVEKYTRFTYPFAVLILTFMGVIVSARKSRGGTGFQIAMGFLLCFIYIFFFMMSKTIAEAGVFQPMFAVWIPNIVFTGVSLLMYKYVPR